MPTPLRLLFGTAFSSALAFSNCFLFCTNLSAQIEPMLSNPTTRAVIVGISKYANISPLRFAHRDAEEFAKHLQSAAGGSVAAENIKLLTNENATSGQIGLAFNWLVSKSEETDRAIIYFSGHGDVETESTDEGYLLAYNAEKSVYMGSGGIPISGLESVIKKLTEKKKAEVMLIADACHSGNLAGSGVNGAKATAVALSAQFDKVVKIMSCEPGQLSQEGEIWGGGHSVFSYYLLNGLRGLADENRNREVTLQEIQGFLIDSIQRAISSFANLQPQTPMAVGISNTVVAQVDDATIAALRKKNSPPQSEPSVAIVSKNAGVLDSVVLRLYRQFEEAMRTKHWLYPAEGAAYSIYQEIKDHPSIQGQKDMMRYSLAAAMQDEAQKAINDYLSADPREMRRRWGLELSRYQLYPQYLEKAAELLGSDNFMYTNLKAKEYYFTGLNLRLQGERNGGDTLLFKAAIPFQEKTLALDPTAAYAYNELGLLARRFKQYEKSVGYFNKAVTFTPTWVLPWVNLCTTYPEIKDLASAEHAGLTAIRLDSAFSLAQFNLGYVYMAKKEYAKSAICFQKSISSDSSYAIAYYNLGLSYYHGGDYQSAEKVWEVYRKRSPNDPDVYQNLGDVAVKLGKPILAEPYFLKAIELDSEYSMAYFSMGELYLSKNETEKSAKWFEQYRDLKPDDPGGYYQLAVLAKKNPSQALQYLETAFKKGFKDYDKLKNELGFDSLRSHPEYKSLIKVYFPEKG